MLIPLLMNLGMLGDADDAADDLWFVDARQAISRSPTAAQARTNSAQAQEARPE